MIEMHHPKKIKNGFSLIEMVIVIGLLGIISAISVFQWHAYRNNTNLRTAARDIVTDIIATRERAISEGIQYRMTFSPTDNNYVIEQGTAGGAPFVTLQTKTPATLGEGSGLAIQSANFSGTARIVFWPRGTLSVGNIVVVNSKGSQATITVNFTGRPRVQFTMQ